MNPKLTEFLNKQEKKDTLPFYPFNDDRENFVACLRESIVSRGELAELIWDLAQSQSPTGSEKA